MVTKNGVCLCLILLCTLACQEKLPEYHGVYAMENGEFTELQSHPATEVPLNFSSTVSILVFQKVLGGGLLDPADYIRIDRCEYIRKEIELVLRGTAGRVDSTIEREASYYRTTLPVPSRFKPMKNETEMIEVVPAEPLNAGLYRLSVGDRHFPFTIEVKRVGTEKLSELSLAENFCSDRILRTVDINKNFSWDAWFKLTQGAIGDKARATSGNVIIEEEYFPCGLWEKYEEAEEAVKYYGTAMGPKGEELLSDLVAGGVPPNTKLNGQTLLTLATTNGHAHLVQKLLEAGADPNLRSYADAPLYWAAANGGDEYYEIARLLLEAGADPNHGRESGWRPICFALEWNNARLLDLLVEHGASTEPPCPEGLSL